MKGVIRQVFAIADVTFNELIRERILWSTTVFAMFILALSFAVSQLSFYEPWRIALDFGAGGIALTGSLLAIVIGGALVSREVKDRTLYLVLTKSIWRWQFVLGKLVGLFAVIVVNSLLMYVVMMAVYLVAGGQFHIVLVENLLLQLCEFCMLATLATFFSVFSTATLSGIFTFSIWLMGHAMDDIKIAIDRLEATGLRTAMRFLVQILPDFTAFDIKPQLSHGIPVPLPQLGLCVAYAIVFCTFTLLGACLVFSKRDL